MCEYVCSSIYTFDKDGKPMIGRYRDRLYAFVIHFRIVVEESVLIYFSIQEISISHSLNYRSFWLVFRVTDLSLENLI